MKGISIGSALLSCLVLAGCAGTSLRVNAPYQPRSGQNFTYEIVDKAGTSEEALTILRQRLTSQLEANGLLATSSAGSAGAVEIVITNYRMRHGAVRALAGIMAGTDNMLSTVVVKDAKTNEVLSKFEIESKNPSAWGTSHGMIEDHADKIVNYLKSGQP